jgi:hypothetical protein
MKNKLLTTAGLLALLAVLGHSYAKPLLAQVTAVLIKNIDERGRTPYQQHVFCERGVSPDYCQAQLPPVPLHTRLVVEYISALVLSTTPHAVNLVTNTLPFRFWYFNAVPRGQPSQYVITQPMTAFFDAGEIAAIGVGGTQVSGAVTVSGYLVDLTQ